MIGKTLGHYQIIDKLGAGGMGEVYRAEDTKLGRQVAIKVLPDAFARDPERLARFEREAKLLALLNHPNIAAIYGLEEADGKRFLVLELVEGQTLEHQIGVGADPRVRPPGGAHRGAPLQIDTILDICRQIAEGLEAAHEKGIIHRDLKPANIKITPEGKVKILDFGLAKALEGEGAGGQVSGAGLTQSPTLTEQMSRPGVILGTAAYMSPEQAKGKPLDKRTDIWAFGCLLFECLTRKRAFAGETVSETLASILKGEPDWTALPQDTPEKVPALLRRCLQKDSKQRLHDIADARIEIDDLLAQSIEAPAPRADMPRPQPLWRWALPWCLAVLMAVLASVAVWSPWRRTPTENRTPVRFAIDLPQGEFFVGPGSAVAISPDGAQIVYTAQKEDSTQLWVRPAAGLSATPLPGTEGARAPFFSRDGLWLGFFAEGKLKKVRVSGGAPQTVCSVDQARSACWCYDDTILLGSRTPGTTALEGLMKVPASGGEPAWVSTPESRMQIDSVYRLHRWPRILPGGKAVLFTRYLGTEDICVAALSLETGKQRVLISPGACGQYLPNKQLVYAWKGDLYAVPLDPDTLQVGGQPVRSTENVLMTGSDEALFDLSGAGSLVYVAGGTSQSDAQLVWVELDGKVSVLPSAPKVAQSLRISPDGRQLLVRDAERSFQLYDIERETWRRLTDGRGVEFWSLFNPHDSRQVVFNSTRAVASAVGLFSISLDASHKIEALAQGEYHQQPQSFTPDGKYLIYQEGSSPVGGLDIWKLPLEGDRKPQPLIQTRFNEFHPTVSPDGLWLAYVTDEFGPINVYLRPFVGNDPPIQISANGGQGPLWSPGGRQLYYRSLDGNKVMGVSLQTNPTRRIGMERILFTGSYKGDGIWGRNYDLAPDGKRFLMIRETKPQPRRMIVVVNWSEELKRLVPTNK